MTIDAFAMGSVVLGAGETTRTASGRTTSPFPRIDTTSDRRACATLRRVSKWLLDEALAELEHRGADQVRLLSGLDRADSNRMTPAEYSTCEVLLFDPDFWAAIDG